MNDAISMCQIGETLLASGNYKAGVNRKHSNHALPVFSLLGSSNFFDQADRDHHPQNNILCTYLCNSTLEEREIESVCVRVVALRINIV